MAAIPAANGGESPFTAAPPQQRAPPHRSKRRADQLQEPAPTITALSTSLFHIPASTLTTHLLQQQPTLHAPPLPSARVQQLGADLLLFPPPSAESTTAAAAECTAEQSLTVVAGPTRWTGSRASAGLSNNAALLPHDVITQLHHVALTTQPSAPLTQSAFISAPPTAAPASSSSASSSYERSLSALSLDRLQQTTKRLRRERRALLAGMARDVRVVNACVRGISSDDEAVNSKVHMVGSSAGSMLESAVRRLGEVNDQLTLLTAVIQHQTAEVT